MSLDAEIALLKRLGDASPPLASRVQRIADVVEPLLTRIYAVFPAYTDHGRLHSEQVLNVLDWLLPADMTAPLVGVELFYLVCAAFLHDVGMLDALENVGNLEAQARIRDSHHLRSETYVQVNYARLGLNKIEADAISEICRSHRKIDIQRGVADLPDGRGGRVRMRLLCAAVRLADELHLTADRAPQLVLDAIQPPPESLAHFQKHLSIDAVGPLGAEGEVEIHARVQTSAAEQALKQMESEIQAKLEEIRPILAEHGVRWNTVRVVLHRRRVVERKVLLQLVRAGSHSPNQLSAVLGESLSEIETSLEDLRQLHHIHWSGGQNACQLVADERVFEHLLRLFLRTEDEFSFTTSEYCRQCIEEFVFGSLCERFDAVYDAQQRADRILVLSSSPTALYLLFHVAGFQTESAIVPRRAVFDAALTLGVLTDMFRFPEIAQIRDIVPAAMAVNHETLKQGEQLLSLFKGLGPDLGRDMNDVFGDILELRPLNLLGQESGVAATVTVTHPESSVRRGLTFPHLLRAAQRSGSDLPLAGAYVQMSVKTGGDILRKSDTLDHLIVSPGRPSPIAGCLFCRLDLDRVMRRITLLIDPERSDDRVRYPLIVEFTLAPGQVTNFKFQISGYLPGMDVEQTLLHDEMLQWLGTRSFHRLVLALDQVDPVTGEPIRTLADALAANLQGAFEAPFLDPEMRDILGALAVLQRRLGSPIATPLKLTAEQKLGIKALALEAADLTDTEILQRLSFMAEERIQVLTSIRISAYFANRQLASDRFFGPIPRTVPRIRLEDETSEHELAEYLLKGEGIVRFSNPYRTDASSLAQRIFDAYADGQPIDLAPDWSADEDVQCIGQVTIHPIEDRLWYREQVVRYQIYDVAQESAILREAHEALGESEVGRACSILRKGLLALPDDPVLLAMLGWAEFKAGDVGSAYADSLRSVDLQGPDWPVPVSFAYFNLGLFALLRGAFGEGWDWYRKAVLIDRSQALADAIADLEASDIPTQSEFLYASAILYEAQGNTPKTIELCKSIVALAESSGAVKERAQDAIRRLERTTPPDSPHAKPSDLSADSES